jgi:hypothetical protein
MTRTKQPKIYPYSGEKLESIQDLIEQKQKHGQKALFDIRIDDVSISGRTEDTVAFEGIKKFIFNDTEKIEIILFAGESNVRETTWVLMLKEDAPLSGIPQPAPTQPAAKPVDLRKAVQEEIEKIKQAEELALWRKRAKHYKKQLTELEQEHEEAEEKIFKLIEQIENLKEKQHQFAEGGKMGGAVLGTIREVVKSLPQNSPALKALGSLPFLNPAEPEPEPEDDEPEVEVMQVKQPTTVQVQPLSDYALMGERLGSKLDSMPEDTKEQAVQIIDYLIGNPQDVKEIHGLIFN